MRLRLETATMRDNCQQSTPFSLNALDENENANVMRMSLK